MSDFRRGDTVVLKSGGPTMTVSAAVEGGKVICIRFDDEKCVVELFEPTALVLEEEAILPAKEDD
jgi:uncharacterized protein YodC (DUF2158 family)